jgi:hypothetical protein
MAKDDLMNSYDRGPLERSTVTYDEEAEPILIALLKEGLSLVSLDDLINQPMNYKSAIPILIYWLPLVQNVRVKETIVRALSIPWAKKTEAQKLLVHEFLVAEPAFGLQWAIGNALSVVADDVVLTDLIELVLDKRHGKAREMVTMALGNMKGPRAEDVLISLLADEEVAGHAIVALGKLKSKKSILAIERFQSHPKTWIRNAAKKALARIRKSK